MRSPILLFREKEYDLSQRTLIMGVVNVTPDSFSDGGRFFEWTKAVERGRQLAAEGADILDVGGESTRPGSNPVPEEEEVRRVIPVIEELKGKITIPISIDTRKARVADRALKAGAEMVNDVSALRFDEAMAGTVARWRVPLVLMHMRGQPETMQVDTHYKNLIGEILGFFEERMAYALSRGVPREAIVVGAGVVGLERMVDRLADDHAHARLLAERLAAVPGIAVDLTAVQTNIVNFRTEPCGVEAPAFSARLRERGVLAGARDRWTIRMVTHRHVRATDVEAAAETVVAVVADRVPAAP